MEARGRLGKDYLSYPGEVCMPALASYPTKDRAVAIVLALFLGVFGIHRFYLEEWKMGVLYLVFSWSSLPFFLGLWDAYKYYANPESFNA